MLGQYGNDGKGTTMSTRVSSLLGSDSTCSPKSSVRHILGTETYLMEPNPAYPVYENKVFFLACRTIPEAEPDSVFFSTDDIYAYHPFCDVMHFFYSYIDEDS
jgi:hypothetical protein